MQKFKKSELLAIISTLQETNNLIALSYKKIDNSELFEALTQCQEYAVEVGTFVETLDCDTTGIVSRLEQYCEIIYQLSCEIDNDEKFIKLTKACRSKLLKIEQEIRTNITDRKELVFFPYKPSMWDSMESVYLAAVEDGTVDVFVVPIPYYDKNSDGTFGQLHYEGDKYPEYVHITSWEEYDITERRPDVVFIHNPYDGTNTVTSVHTDYYSNKLKQYTDCLVYIPYYATTGGMGEAQAMCMAYVFVDYIVIQSEKYVKLFDSTIPRRKFLVMGSPKFDSIIRKCQLPQEAPEQWKEKMQGKKVFFYNTSLSWALTSPYLFLNKMEYVFKLFKDRQDVCLLWRPHPLLETTFSSMLPEYKERFIQLRDYYLHENIGIYDNTPDMEKSIALSDVYIGDDATSVTASFGMAGKYLFILNNYINELPQKDDWRAQIIGKIKGDGNLKYLVSMDNQLYYSPDNNGRYEYMCKLSRYSGGNYYVGAVEINGRVFVLPSNAQDILIVSNDKSIKKIPLRRELEGPGAFSTFIVSGKYIFLIPHNYPYIVRFSAGSEEVEYVECLRDIGKRPSGDMACWFTACLRYDKLCAIDMNGENFIEIDVETLQVETKNVCLGRAFSKIQYDEYENVFWLISYEGTIITKYNPETNTSTDYDFGIEGIESVNRITFDKCNVFYFGSMAFTKDSVIAAAYWGNKFVCLNRATGIVSEWKVPFDTNVNNYNCYYYNGGVAIMCKTDLFGDVCINVLARKVYKVDVENAVFTEIPISFDENVVKSNVSGFSEDSEWLQYCCREDGFNSLKDLLDDNISGNQFSKDAQIAAFSKVNVSMDGSCGEKVFNFVKNLK